MPEILTQEEIEALLEVIDEDFENAKRWIDDLKKYIDTDIGEFKEYKVRIFIQDNSERHLFITKIVTKLTHHTLKNKLRTFFEMNNYKVIEIKIEKKYTTDKEETDIYVEWSNCFLIIENIKIGKIYRHYYKNDEYFVLDFCKIQDKNKWKDAVLYQKVNSNKKFVRELQEFKDKFY